MNYNLIIHWFVETWLKKTNHQKTWLFFAGVVVLLLAALTYGNYMYSIANPGGTDFLVHWIGTRALFTEGISPYSDDVALRIQTAVYGRAAQSGEHELRVAYPLYSIVLFAPFSLFNNYNLARAIWMTFLEIGSVVLTYLSVKLTTWKPGRKMWIGLILFSIFWYHSLRAIINGNVIIIIALFVTLAIYAVKIKSDELAGVLLAFSTIKPQVVVIILAAILIWAVIQKRNHILLWFVITLAFLSISSTLLVPDWIIQNFREVMRYPGYNPPGTPSAALATWFPVVGPRLGFVISIAVMVILLFEWWLSRKSDYRHFLWVSCLTLTVSPWIGIQTDPGNFVTMVPAIILVFAIINERWKEISNIIIGIFMVMIFIGLWILFITTLEVSYQPIQSPILFFPLPLFLLIMLYWIRTWAIRPPLLYYDSFQNNELLKKL